MYRNYEKEVLNITKLWLLKKAKSKDEFMYAHELIQKISEIEAVIALNSGDAKRIIVDEAEDIIPRDKKEEV